jgi:lysyl-tRNA synthetase class 1
VDVEAQVQAEKASALTPRELEVVAERKAAARAWLDTYAPERAIVAVQQRLPASVNELDAEQREYLADLAQRAADEAPANGELWQALIFTVAGDHSLPNGRAFAALYAAFLGRPNGPRAGWLLASLDPAFVTTRLHEAAMEGAPA